MMFLTELRATPRNDWATADHEQDSEEAAFRPRVGLSEAEDAFLIRIELPGVPADKVDLTVTGEKLTIRGERAKPVLAEGERGHVDEMTWGSFERTFRFQAPIDPDAVQATSRDGILDIRVAKARESLPRKVQITSK